MCLCLFEINSLFSIDFNFTEIQLFMIFSDALNLSIFLEHPVHFDDLANNEYLYVIQQRNLKT